MLRTTKTSYTLTGKPATTTDANGNLTRYAYDLDDRLTSLTDAVGRITTFGYDALSRPAQVSNAAIQSAPLVQRAYTADGLTASLTIARNNSTFNVTNLTYDGFDRLATTTYPDSSTETLTYDADSNVLTRLTRAGQTITFTYDTLSRLATKAAPSEPTVTYAYDLAGRLLGGSDTSSAITAAATLGSPGEFTWYAASKGAIDTFTLGLAREVAKEGVRVNAVSPGLIETDIHASGGEPKRVARMSPTIPMQRAGTTEEVAEAILWLLSDKASYVTGANVRVAGGR